MNKKNILFIILCILGVIVSLAIGYLIVVGLIKLICLCFGLVFSWKIATGVWLVLCLLSMFFGKNKSE